MSSESVFHVERDGPTLIVTPRMNVSRLADEAVETELHEMQNAFQQAQVKNLVIDFGRISYFGSSMLEAMRSLGTHVRAAGGKMAVCNAAPVCREILHVARFDTLWPLLDSRAEALASVQDHQPPGPPAPPVR